MKLRKQPIKGFATCVVSTKVSTKYRDTFGIAIPKSIEACTIPVSWNFSIAIYRSIVSIAHPYCLVSISNAIWWLQMRISTLLLQFTMSQDKCHQAGWSATTRTTTRSRRTRERAIISVAPIHCDNGDVGPSLGLIYTHSAPGDSREPPSRCCWSCCCCCWTVHCTAIFDIKS